MPPGVCKGLMKSKKWIGVLRLVNKSWAKEVNANIKQVLLNGENFRSVGIDGVVHALHKSLPCLESIDCDKVESDWLEAVSGTLGGKLTSLSFLNCSDQHWEFLPRLSNLQSFDHLGHCTLGKENLVWVSALAKLKQLSLYSHVLSADALECLHNLERLEIGAKVMSSVQSLGCLTRLVDLKIHCQLVHGGVGFCVLSALTNLTNLDASMSGFNDNDASYLAHLDNLKELNLSQSKVSNSGFGYILCLSVLTKLDLKDTFVTEEGLESIHCLSDLQCLNVGRRDLTKWEANFVSQLPKVSKLGVSAQLKDAGMDNISRLTMLKDLEILVYRVTNHTLSLLGDLHQLDTLRLDTLRLDTYDVNFFVETVSVDWGCIPHLRKLRLHGISWGDMALTHLSRLRKLEDFYMWSAGVTNDGMRHLVDLQSLTKLHLWVRAVSDDGADRLSVMTNLDMLAIDSISITEECKARLGRSLPFCKMYW